MLHPIHCIVGAGCLGLPLAEGAWLLRAGYGRGGEHRGRKKIYETVQRALRTRLRIERKGWI